MTRTFAPVVFLILLLSTAPKTLAQTEKWSFGGGLALTSDEFFTAGLDLRAFYQLDKFICIVPSITLFAPKKQSFSAFSTSFEVKYRAISFSVDGQYRIPLEIENTELYALAGINYVALSAKVETSGLLNATSTAGDEGIGLNLGAGISYDLKERFLPFLDIRYTVGNVNYSQVLAGVRISV